MRSKVSMRNALVFAFAIAFAVVARTDAIARPGKDKVASRGVKSDVKYIACQTCELAANAAYETYLEVKTDKGKKLTEMDVLEKIEKVCSASDKAGEWIITKDLQEKGTTLRVVDMGKENYGACGTECKTIVMACEDILGRRDTDVAEYLFTTAKSAKDVREWLCKEETSTCRKAAPPLPKDRPKGEKFVKKDKKDVEMERLMASMQGMPGMGGAQLFNREDMMRGMGGMGGGDDDDDDDENPYGKFDPSTMKDMDDVKGAKGGKLGAKLNGAARKAKSTMKNAWGGVKSLFSNSKAAAAEPEDFGFSAEELAKEEL